MFGMDDNEIEKMLESHPLTVFSKLVSDDPNNKVFKKCLDNEIESAAKQLAENVGEDQLVVIEHIINLVPDDASMVAGIAGNKEMREVALKVSIIKRILAAVKKVKGIEEGDDDD